MQAMTMNGYFRQSTSIFITKQNHSKYQAYFLKVRNNINMQYDRLTRGVILNGDETSQDLVAEEKINYTN